MGEAELTRGLLRNHGEKRGVAERFQVSGADQTEPVARSKGGWPGTRRWTKGYQAAQGFIDFPCEAVQRNSGENHVRLPRKRKTFCTEVFPPFPPCDKEASSTGVAEGRRVGMSAFGCQAIRDFLLSQALLPGNVSTRVLRERRPLSLCVVTLVRRTGVFGAGGPPGERDDRVIVRL